METKKEVIHVKNQEEWEYVITNCMSKICALALEYAGKYTFEKCLKGDNEGIALCIENNSYSGLNYWREEGYNIISFEEWLKTPEVFPKSKFNVGDVVNTDNSGFQYTDMARLSKDVTYNWKTIKECNVPTSNRYKVKVLSKVYSKYTKCWWYNLENYGGNWVNEECMSLYTEENVSEPSEENLVGRYLKALVDSPESTNYKKGEFALIKQMYPNSNKCEVMLDRLNFSASISKKAVWELMPEGFEPDKSTDKIDLTGRYLKALVKYPEGTGYKTGEYAKIIEYRSPTSVILDRCGCLADTQHEDWQLMPEGFDPTVPEHLSFYVRYTEGFTEDLFNALREWCKDNSKGKERGYSDSYEGLKKHRYYFFDNWGLRGTEYSPEAIVDIYCYGVDNNRQSCEKEYSVEEVKKLIGYVEPVVSEYLEAIGNFHSYIIKGRVYKLHAHREFDSISVVCNLKCGAYLPEEKLFCRSYQFIPSTKEAYDAQVLIGNSVNNLNVDNFEIYPLECNEFTGFTISDSGYMVDFPPIYSQVYYSEQKTTVDKDENIDHQSPVVLKKSKNKKSILVLTV